MLRSGSGTQPHPQPNIIAVSRTTALPVLSTRPETFQSSFRSIFHPPKNECSLLGIQVVMEKISVHPPVSGRELLYMNKVFILWKYMAELPRKAGKENSKGGKVYG